MTPKCAMYSPFGRKCGAPANFKVKSRLSDSKPAWCCETCFKVNRRVLMTWAEWKVERETASAIHAIHGLPGEPEPEGGQE